MGRRSSLDPYGNADTLVDSYIGEAYKKVRLVADNLSSVSVLALAIGERDFGQIVTDFMDAAASTAEDVVKTSEDRAVVTTSAEEVALILSQAEAIQTDLHENFDDYSVQASAARDEANSARDQAVSAAEAALASASDSDNSAESAAAAEQTAIEAANAAVIAVLAIPGVFPDTTAGLSATVNGESFLIYVSSNSLKLYRNDSNSATLISEFNWTPGIVGAGTIVEREAYTYRNGGSPDVPENGIWLSKEPGTGLRLYVWVSVGNQHPSGDGSLVGTTGWYGLKTQREMDNMSLDKWNTLPKENVEDQVDQNTDIANLHALGIGSFKARALSSAAGSPVAVTWSQTGIRPDTQTLSFGGYLVTLDGGATEYTSRDQSITTRGGVVGNSLSDSTDEDKWSNLLFEDALGVSFTSVARYSSDARQVYRLGVEPILLTIPGGLPATGDPAEDITLINGVVPSNNPDLFEYGGNPASFLNTGDAGLTTGVSMDGFVEGRAVTVSITNAAATDYKIIQTTPGAEALALSGAVTFIPAPSLDFVDATVVVWMGNNYYKSGVPNAYGDYTNPQLWVDLGKIIPWLQARGNRVILLPIIPATNMTTSGTGNDYDAMEAANARTASLYPDLWAGDLLAALQAVGDGGATDNADIAAGFVPTSLRKPGDLLHLNSNGDAVVVAFIEAFMAVQALPPVLAVGDPVAISATGTQESVGDLLAASAVVTVADPNHVSADDIVETASAKVMTAAERTALAQTTVLPVTITSGGAADTLTGTTPNGQAPVAGQIISFTVAADNTGAVTLALNGGAARNLTSKSGANLQAGSLTTNSVYQAVTTSDLNYKLIVNSPASAAQVSTGTDSKTFVTPATLKTDSDARGAALQIKIEAVMPNTATPIFARAGPSGELVMVGFAATDEAGAGAPILTNDGQLLRMGPDGAVELVIGRDEVTAADDAVRAEFTAADAALQDEIDALATSSGSAAVEAALPTGQAIAVTGRRIAMGVAGPSGAGLPLVTEDGRLIQLLPTGQAHLIPLARIEKLRRAAQRALAFNSDDADIATGVTMTVNAATDATLTNSYTASANLDLFRFAGGNVIANSSGSSLYFPVSSVAPATNGNVGSVDTIPDDQQAWGWRAEFETDASKVEVRLGSSTGDRFRVLVDGRYVSKTPSYGLNYVAYVSLDFSAVRRPRIIGVEGSDTNTFRGVSVGATANLWRPQRSPDRIVALCTGDSYSEGQGTSPSPGVLGFPQMLGRMLGWTDVRQVAVGGTGYFNTGPSGARSKLYDQIDRWMTVNSDLRPDDVDVVMCLSGYNDYPAISGTTYTPAEIAAEALRCWRKMRTLLPGALIIVGGPHSGNRGPDQRTIDIEAALAAAFGVWVDPLSAYVPLAPSTARAWISGTGRVNATTGSGNADVMIATDATHPTELGHQLYARRFASEIRRIIANFA